MNALIKMMLIAVLLCFGSAAHAFAGLNAINIAVKWDGIRQSAASEISDQIASGEEASIPLPGADFGYSYSRARTQQNLRNFVARTPDPAARAELERMFAARPTLMDDISAGVRGYGFDPHDVADAYAVWWINVWGASQRRNIEPDAQTVEAVKQQVRSAFAATPDMANTTDADRQEYAEALLIQAAMLGSAFEQMKGDPQLLDQLAEAARQGAKADGLDLARMTLTPNGFVPRKGAHAGEESVRNARVDAAGAEGESSGMGLALAAGAGLGVTLLGGAALLCKHG